MKKGILQNLVTAAISLITFFVFAPALYAIEVNTVSINDMRVTYISVGLDETWEVHGFTAPMLFGRPTAALAQFHEATAYMHGDEVLIFPVNFFNTGSDFSIVEPIFSHGQLLTPLEGSSIWINPGAGFDSKGNFHLFSPRNNRYGRYVSPGRFTVGPLANYEDFDIDAVFAPFPHLVDNGVRLTVEPEWFFTANQINNRLVRAFMGQRADGTFIVGHVSAASIPDLQDVAEMLGLVNATNIDGGASASIMVNGNIVIPPGRQLASVAVITGKAQNAASPLTPGDESGISVIIDGQAVVFANQPPVIVDGSTLVPVRGVFEQLGFNVDWHQDLQQTELTRDNDIILITIGSSMFTANGISYSLAVPAQNIGGSTMLPIRALLEAVGYDLNWDENTQTVIITTN